MPVLAGYRLRPVVPVAARVRPADGVQHHHGEGPSVPAGQRPDRPELVVHGVVVVVPVEEDDVHLPNEGPGLQAGQAVDDQARVRSARQGREVAPGRRIDRVEGRALADAMTDQQLGVPSASHTDLDEDPRLQGRQKGLGDQVPESMHGALENTA